MPKFISSYVKYIDLICEKIGDAVTKSELIKFRKLLFRNHHSTKANKNISSNSSLNQTKNPKRKRIARNRELDSKSPKMTNFWSSAGFLTQKRGQNVNE